MKVASWLVVALMMGLLGVWIRHYRPIKTWHLHEIIRFISRHTQHYQRVEIERFEVKTPCSRQRPLKIVQFSDLHYNSFEDPPTLPKHLEQEMVDKVIMERPDYVVITGDFLYMERFSDALQSIHRDGKKRLWGVLGNHDLHARQRGLLLDILKNRGGVSILDNDYYYDEESDLLLMGLPDYDADYFNTGLLASRLPATISKCAIRVVLSHIPDSADCLLLNKPKENKCSSDLKAQLVLSGHTHGGQFVLPLMSESIIPIMFRSLPTKIMDFLLHSIKMSNPVLHWEWSVGLFEKQPKGTELSNHPREKPLDLNAGNSYLHVNRGMGAHFGFRILCHPGMSVFEFN